jgi:hypothetical protein
VQPAMGAAFEIPAVDWTAMNQFTYYVGFLDINPPLELYLGLS